MKALDVISLRSFTVFFHTFVGCAKAFSLMVHAMKEMCTIQWRSNLMGFAAWKWIAMKTSRVSLKRWHFFEINSTAEFQENAT